MRAASELWPALARVSGVESVAELHALAAATNECDAQSNARARRRANEPRTTRACLDDDVDARERSTNVSSFTFTRVRAIGRERDDARRAIV